MRLKIHLLLVFFLLSIAGTFAQQVFLNPDPTNVTEAGAFDLSIEVDGSVTGFRGYRFVFSYDDQLMDFVSAEKGSIFNGFYSYWWRVFDVSADSLHIECMIFGAGLSVDGPGPVLTMHFQTLDEGTTALHFKDCRIYAEDGTVMPGIIPDDGMVNINFTPLVSLQGTVTNQASGVPLSGIDILASNGGGTVTTDANGSYQFSLPEGWSGTITPQCTGYSFTPATRSYNNLTAPVSDANFSRTPNQITLSGFVYDAAGNSVSRVRIWFGDTYGFTRTSHWGYQKTVTAGSAGTITPVKTGYAFTPDHRDWTDITTAMTEQNFVAQPTTQTYTISGVIMDAETGVLLPGVKVTFTGGGGYTYTDAMGSYAHEVPFAWSGYIYPTIYTHVFTPRKKYHFNVRENHSGQNFAAIQSYHITGNVNDQAINFPLAGMRVVFNNNGDTAICNAQGFYDHQVAKGWSGDAAPTMPGYSSTPPSRHYAPVYEDYQEHCYCGWAYDGTVSFTVNSGEACTWGSVHELSACCCLGDLVVEPGGEAIMEAGTDLVLSPGFHAKAGSSFHAFVTPIAPPIKTAAGPLDESTHQNNIRNNKPLVYPNPFQSTITFEFTVQRKNTLITISLFDMSGNRVALKTEHLDYSGHYATTLNGHNLMQGVYFYRIDNGTQYFTGKIIKTH